VKSIALGYAQKTFRKSVRFGRTITRQSLEREAIRLKNEAVRRGSGLIRIAEDDGWVKFRASELSGVGHKLPSLLERANEWKTDPSRVDEKQMPRNILKQQDLFDHREIMDIALHDDILAAVSDYMGQVPRLHTLFLWWSPPNQSAMGSQLYHYDHRDSRQAKVFINLTDVTSESGPLHFLTPPNSLKVDAKVGYSQSRYTDEEVYSAVSRDDAVAAEGEAGTGFLVDTARCLHYGSRGNAIDRMILMVSFARINCVKPGGSKVLDNVRDRLADELFESDPVRALVLKSPM
jgi:hypothetical protein